MRTYVIPKLWRVRLAPRGPAALEAVGETEPGHGYTSIAGWLEGLPDDFEGEIVEIVIRKAKGD